MKNEPYWYEITEMIGWIYTFYLFILSRAAVLINACLTCPRHRIKPMPLARRMNSLCALKALDWVVIYNKHFKSLSSNLVLWQWRARSEFSSCRLTAVWRSIMQTDGLFGPPKYVHKHVLYSANILRNFQRRSYCKELTENSRKIVKPHRGVIISVVIRSGNQPSWSGAPFETFKNTLSDRVAFQFSISSAVVSSTCEVPRGTKLQKPWILQHFQICN